MESVRKARARLQNYPVMLAQCGPQSTLYSIISACGGGDTKIPALSFK